MLAFIARRLPPAAAPIALKNASFQVSSALLGGRCRQEAPTARRAVAARDRRTATGGRPGSLDGMTLRLHDTAAREVRTFTPVTPGRASLYLCGATVQAPPHIGHVRSGVDFDILVRWLAASGYQVTFCRNVTDIDDKIL